jgi:hypothetical protein
VGRQALAFGGGEFAQFTPGHRLRHLPGGAPKLAAGRVQCDGGRLLLCSANGRHISAAFCPKYPGAPPETFFHYLHLAY